MKAGLVAAPLLLSLCGCFSAVVWHGKSPDRSRAAVVLQDLAGQRVQIDGRDGEVFAGIGVDALVWSPDGKRVAYPARTPAGWIVVIDDGGTAPPAGEKERRARAAATFEGIGEIVWSADGRHLAFAAARAGKWLVVTDGREGPPLDSLRVRSLRLSAEGTHTAYAGGEGGKVVMVVDGVKSPPYDAVGRPSFGEGGRAAFVARRGGQAFVVAGGEESPPYEDVVELSFSPSGRKLAWIARTDGAWHVIAGGLAGEPHERVSRLVWAPRTEALAYAAGDGATESVVVKGVAGAAYEGILPDSIRFDASGETVAYAARRQGAWRAVVGAEESEPYDDMGQPIFAGDSSAVAFLARRGQATFLVVDGRQGPVVADAAGLVLSADGRRFLHLARAEQKVSVVEGAVRGGPCGGGRCTPVVTRTTHHDIVVGGTLAFSEGGAHSGYLAGQALGRKLFLVIDGERAGAFDMDELMAGLVVEPDMAGALTGDSKQLLRWVRAEATLAERRASVTTAGARPAASDGGAR